MIQLCSTWYAAQDVFPPCLYLCLVAVRLRRPQGTWYRDSGDLVNRSPHDPRRDWPQDGSTRVARPWMAWTDWLDPGRMPGAGWLARHQQLSLFVELDSGGRQPRLPSEYW